MTAAVPVHFPSSRTLAAWWPDLRTLQPEALWVRHLVLHRIEAPVEAAPTPEQAALARGLLEALARGEMHPGLEPGLVERWLNELACCGLVKRQGHWRPTAAGEAVLRGERPRWALVERRTFYFEANAADARFVPLQSDAVAPWPADDPGSFDLAWLKACIDQPLSWKETAGFPLDVLGVVRPDPERPVNEAQWQRITIERAEHLLVLFVLSRAGEGEVLRGFAIHPTTWQLHLQQPALTLGSGWRGVLPELTVGPEPEQWQQAWRSWGQPRSIPTADMEECVLERVGPLLRVHAPARLIERLRGVGSDAVKGEAWLLAGDEQTRSLALVDLVERA